MRKRRVQLLLVILIGLTNRQSSIQNRPLFKFLHFSVRADTLPQHFAALHLFINWRES
jgi:hypothetical protein